MKKITLLLFLLTSSLGFSQQQLYNLGFEPSTPSGAASNWFTFDNGAPAAEVVTNPDPDGVNTSATTKVLKCVMGPGNAFYAGVNNRWQDSAFGTWKIDAAVPSNLTVSMDINKNYVGTIGIKMGTNSGATTFQITDQNVANSIVDEWQTITWTIPSIPATLETNISQFVIFVDWTQGGPDRAPNSTIYIDNIRFNAEKLTDPVTCSDGIQNGSETGIDCGGTACAPCPGQEPTDAAPTPPARNAADVVSIFSGAYANVTLNELPTGWSSLGTFASLPIAGDSTWKITGLDFMGMVTNYATGVDLSTMENMHIDYWTPSTNGIEIKIVNTVDGGEAIASLGTTVTGSWQSKDIPMSTFAALSNKTKITQLLIDATGAGTSTVFVDNFYFYKGTPLSTTNFSATTFSSYPNPTQESWTVKANNTSSISSIQVFDVLGKNVISITPNSTEAIIDARGLNSGLYFARVSSENGSSVIKLIKN